MITASAAKRPSVFDSWTDAYDVILKAVEQNFKAGPEEISKCVDELHEVFKADPNFEEAYRRWSDVDEETQEQLYI